MQQTRQRKEPIFGSCKAAVPNLFARWGGETGGGAQAVKQGSCFLRLWAAHLLLCGPVPNRPRTGTILRSGGLGTPDVRFHPITLGPVRSLALGQQPCGPFA